MKELTKTVSISTATLVSKINNIRCGTITVDNHEDEAEVYKFTEMFADIDDDTLYITDLKDKNVVVDIDLNDVTDFDVTCTHIEITTMFSVTTTIKRQSV